MRRRRSGGGAAPAEPCGVWLDTAELKRGPARPLSAKLKGCTRAPERKHSPGLLPQPGTRQTTIPTFFSSHTDETDKENTRPPVTPNKDCEHSGAALAACPVKILPLPQLERAREEPPGAEQGVQGTSRAWKTPLELQGEPQSQSQASPGAGAGAGEDPWSCSFSQGSEHSRIRNKSRSFPRESASGSRKTQPWGRADPGTGSAGTEDTNPAPGAAPRGVCSPQPLRERGQVPGGSQGGSCRQLFCQDSQGNRVIADRDRDRDRDSPLEDSPSPSPRQPWGLQPELGSEALFTQDSEGNRVIKHW